MAATLTPPTRRRQDRRLVVLLTFATVLFVAETFLRINGLLPPFVGEAMFATGVTAGLVGTLLLAWTAPAATTDRERVRETTVQPRRREARDRRESLVRRPVLDL